MNYISQLKEENTCLKEQIHGACKELNDFIDFLNGPKFNGVQSDGSRKDWIATSDTINRMREIRSGLKGL